MNNTHIVFDLFLHTVGIAGWDDKKVHMLKVRLEQAMLRELIRVEDENNGCPVFTQIKSEAI